ncbi:MAG: hydantoinase/oxoprolinase family protein, partial [Euzebyaceae bacterium]|nr:hydantoinase/oxoprolinase family protein [Euzebyaceae bacterium]
GGTAPTVTDAHCVLGHLGEGQALGGLRLDAAAAAAALGTLPEEAGGAAGVLTVVRATMGRALRRVTTERGVDPAGLALVAYGGAGPLHATAIGRDLGCRAVVVPPAPGVLSALGLLLAPPRYETSRTVMAAPGDALEQLWRTLEDDARTELARQGVSGDVRVDRLADARYAGQSHELRLAVSDGGDVASLLHAAHADAYGYAMTDEPVEVVTLRVVAEGAPALTGLPSAWDQGDPSPASSRRIGVGDGEIEARVIDRSSLAPGDEVGGPALVEQHDTTTLLAPGDVARIDAAHNLVMTWATGP